MKFLRKIKEIISRIGNSAILDTTFVFPYSSDKEIRAKQIIYNLKKGLLLEDKKVLISWMTAYNSVNKYKVKRRDSGDRTEWYLGNHPILDGYICELEIMMWMNVPWKNTISEITADLGLDYKGMENFYTLKNHLVERIGEPHLTNIKKWGDLDLGIIQWQFNEINISIVGIEHFACKYRLSIGSA